MNARRLTVAVIVAALLAVGLLRALRGGDERPPADAGAGAAPAPARVAPAPAPAVARVAGTVRLDDVPVRGATVRLAIGAASLLATTDGFGHFELGAVPVGSGTIEAAADGATGDSRRLELRTPAGAREAERLELLLSACTDEIFGDVRDVAGAPLAGAEIRVANRVGRSGGRTVADGEGHYRLCVIPWLLGVRAQVAGYGAQLRVVRVAGSVRVDFRLGPEVILEGRVIDDDDEQPVAGAEVWYALDWRDGSVRTDEAGEFHITGLAPGRHRLVASAGDTRSTLGPVEVLAHVGVPVPPVVLRVGRSYLVSGRVEDGGGRAIAGEQVSALGGALAGGQREAVSDENGAFLLGPLPAGRTTLTLASEDGGEPREIVVPLDGEVVLRRRASAWLRGRVMHERRPVAGAAIGIEGGVDARPQGRTRADGSFELGPIAGGAKIVVASHRELGEGTLALTVVDGERRDGLVVELSRGATVSGVVVDQRGAAVAGARVHLWAGSATERGAAATGRDGAFTVTGLTGDDAYKVSVLSSSGMEQLEPAGEPFAPVLLDGAHRRIEGLRLVVKVERGAIGGVVRRATGEPVADATVDASNGVMAAVLAATVTDEQGRFELSDLLEDKVDVRASSDTVTVTVDDVAVGTRALVLTLPATGTLRGELVGFARAPQVTVSRAGRGFVARYFSTVSAGGFVVSELPAGAYLVRARAGGELDEASVAVIAGGEGHVTLRGVGAAHVTLRAVAEASGPGVSGALCGFGLASDPDGAVVYDRTDAEGRLALDVPAGQDLVFGCKPRNIDAEQARPLRRRFAAGESAAVIVVVSRRPHLGLTLMFQGDTAVVERVSGPAAIAGIAPGDTIAAIDGVSMIGASRDVFFAALVARAPGEILRVSLRRREASVEAAILVEKMPDEIAFGEL